MTVLKMIPGNAKFTKGITVFILFAFIITLNSCYTVNEETINPQELKRKENYKILEVKLKSDTVIKLNNYEVMYNSNPVKSEEVLKCEKTDTIVIKKEQNTFYKYRKTLREIKIDDISKIKLEIKNPNSLLYLFIVGVGIALIIILSFVDSGIVKAL